MNIKLCCIEMDTSIQCRAAIDTATVNDYAERMTEGAEFPPIIVYGTQQKAWIADGWHRVMAARQIGAVDIPAELRHGVRVDALKAALSANAAHGLRRTNADKRRAVEIAVKEFGKLSSRAIAELCGVSDKTVEAVRETCGISARETRVDTIGRNQPATRRTSTVTDTHRETETEEPAAMRPSVTQDAPEGEWDTDAPDANPDAPRGTVDGKETKEDDTAQPIMVTAQAIADKAIFFLTQIKPRMEGRDAALVSVITWCKRQLKVG